MSEKMKWTADQQKAIIETRRNVLLTAAAGSGKTAVLSHRCVHLLTDAPDPISFDEMLVLTFTDAAASEMKHRIAITMRDKVAGDVTNFEMQKQLALLDRASISTIHSFCSSVLREFFYLANIDPAFELFDANDALMCKRSIAGSILESYYESANTSSFKNDFSRFIYSYNASVKDANVSELIIRLHSFFGNLGDQGEWLDVWKKQDAVDSSENRLIDLQTAYIRKAIERIQDCLNYALSLLSEFPETDYLQDYITNTLIEKIGSIDNIFECGQRENAITAVATFVFPTKPRRPKTCDVADAKMINDLIDLAKKSFKALSEKIAVPLDWLLAQQKDSAIFANCLVTMVEAFTVRYEETKLAMHMLDFDDLEQKTLALLVPIAHKNQSSVPSDVALELCNRYKAILVDEYQDISPVQEAIIHYIASAQNNVGNLFMVGDVKQSIYGFRQAAPEIFLKKFYQYKLETEEQPVDTLLRIDLNKNFRSNKGIISGINGLFNSAMSYGFSKLDYKQDAQLNFGGEYYLEHELLEKDGALELHFIEDNIDPGYLALAQNKCDPSVDLSLYRATRIEAVVMARRILAIMGQANGDEKASPPMYVFDNETKTTRPIQFTDIVVLLRSLKSQAAIYTEVFTDYGIPVSAELSSGFLEAVEVIDVISLLKVIDNPLQDIYLAGLLRSPIVGISDSQLVSIRTAHKSESFFQCLQLYIHANDKCPLSEKLNDFLQRLSHWRKEAKQQRLADLLWQIYRDTDLLSIVAGLPGGMQRYQNLLYLHDKAAAFDHFLRQGLSRFLRFLENLKDEDIDFSPAKMSQSCGDFVRVMSVHKSKGLEFPVVICPGLSRRFNRMDKMKPILYSRHIEGVFGLKIIDPVTQDRYNTAAHTLIAEDMDERMLTEELRLLYVAMTRAREKLILCGTVHLEKYRINCQKWRYNPDTVLPEFILANANNYYDWIGPALSTHTDMFNFVSGSDSAGLQHVQGVQYQTFAYDSKALSEILETVTIETKIKTTPKTLDNYFEVSSDKNIISQVDSIIERTQWEYPFKDEMHLSARQSVTDLKHQVALFSETDFASERAQLPQANAIKIEPKFMKTKASTPTGGDIGSWTHLLLERVDLSGDLSESGLSQQLDNMIASRLFCESNGKYISLENVAAFYKSEIGHHVINNMATVQREWSFTLAVPPDFAQLLSLLPNNSTDDQSDSSTHMKSEAHMGSEAHILVRGIIDLFYQTPDGIVIIDYKTDNVNKSNVHDQALKYAVPMDLYQKAIEAICQKKVCKKIVYFLSISKGIVL